METNLGGQSKVLVVEDNEQLSQLYAGWLSETYEVITAGSAEEALGMLDDTIDVVLLDRRMPGTSGDRVLPEMRAAAADVRIALVTAVEPAEDVVKLGFDEYLCKPVDAETLRDLVGRLVRRGEFGAGLTRQFAVARKIALLEEHLSASELEESEAYEELKREYNGLNADLVSAVDDLSHEDLGAVIAGH
jgi:DNA-binding response OmpR family regulator